VGSSNWLSPITLGNCSQNYTHMIMLIVIIIIICGPALQFGSLRRNLYSSYRIGLAPLHQTLVLTFVSNPGIFTSGGIKK